VSPAFEIFSIDLKHLPTKLEAEKKIVATSEGNLLRVWFELHGQQATLSTDIRRNQDNHWGNSNYLLQFPQGEVNLNVTYSNGKFLAYIKK
jgi:hypothetical protein